MNEQFYLKFLQDTPFRQKKEASKETNLIKDIIRCATYKICM